MFGCISLRYSENHPALAGLGAKHRNSMLFRAFATTSCKMLGDLKVARLVQLNTRRKARRPAWLHKRFATTQCAQIWRAKCACHLWTSPKRVGAAYIERHTMHHQGEVLANAIQMPQRRAAWHPVVLGQDFQPIDTGLGFGFRRRVVFGA